MINILFMVLMGLWVVQTGLLAYAGYNYHITRDEGWFASLILNVGCFLLTTFNVGMVLSLR